MNQLRRYIRNLDWSILIILVGLAIFSYLGISGSGRPFFANRQMLFYGAGLVVILITLLIDYRWIRQLSPLFYLIGNLSILSLILWGTLHANTLSWFQLGPILIQPAEFMKLFVILIVAHWSAKQKEKQVELRAFYQLWPFFLLFAIPFVLIVKQSDLGNAVVLVGIFLSMMVITGIRLRHFLYLGGAAAFGTGILTFLYFFQNELFFKIIKEYQWERITEFLSPEKDIQGSSYQLTRSLIAIGSGTLQGKGLSSETLSKSNWIPVSQSDFIFSVIGETFGFIGSAILLFLFFLLIYRMIRIAMDAEDPFGCYVISGIIGMFVFQIFENVGMSIGIMPITGITLPFISYGGSSLLTNMLAVAIVLNIGMRSKKLSF
jgi:rod shape-determining protein RodA